MTYPFHCVVRASVRALLCLICLVAPMTAGCSDEGPGPLDSGGGSDAAHPDASRPLDAALPDGAAIDGALTDASRGDATADGARSDAPSPIDAPSTSCPPELGAACGDGMPCGSGLECMVGRCTPQERQICGGFAGAECTDPSFPYCLYFASADFGPCVTPSEAVCLCAASPTSYTSCPGT
jgi:hypothetical protein